MQIQIWLSPSNAIVQLVSVRYCWTRGMSKTNDFTCVIFFSFYLFFINRLSEIFVMKTLLAEKQTEIFISANIV